MKDMTGSVVETTSNLTGTTRKMGMNKDALDRLMGMLSNMYTNPELAVIREYACNGWDSHVAAGTTDRPIEVTLPTSLSPSLMVRDFGVGLSLDEITEVFAEYGSSTKTDSNEQVGGFGIGSKSAFTLSHEFVVTGVKGGKRNVVLFALGEDGVGTIRVMAENVATDEPNGVLISLAVANVDKMRDEAEQLFKFWDAGNVLIDGASPSTIWETSPDVTPDGKGIHIVKGAGKERGQLVVVMGQVPYPVDQSILRRVSSAWQDKTHPNHAHYEPARIVANRYMGYTAIVAKVPIGDIHIAPTREGVRDTPKTYATVERVLLALAEGLTDSLQRECLKEKSPYLAARRFHALRSAYSPMPTPNSIDYKGVALTLSVKVPLAMYNLDGAQHGRRKMYAASPDSLPFTGAGDRVLVVTEDGDEKAQGVVSRGARVMLEETDYTHIVASPTKTGTHGWFTYGRKHGADTMSLDEYREKVKELRAERVPEERNEISYIVGRTAYYGTPFSSIVRDLLASGQKVAIFGRYDSRKNDPLTTEALKDYVALTVTGSQSIEALAKRLTAKGIESVHGQQIEDLTAEHAASKFGAITENDQKALGAAKWLLNNYNYGGQPKAHWLFWLPRLTGKITNPTYKEQMLRVSAALTLAATVSEDRITELEVLGAEPIQFHAEPIQHPTIMDGFPLLAGSRQREEYVPHVIAYINAL